MSERAKRASSVYKEILSSGIISTSHLMDKSNPHPPAVQTRDASPVRKMAISGSERETATLSDYLNMETGTSHSSHSHPTPHPSPNHPKPPLWTRLTSVQTHMDPTSTPPWTPPSHLPNKAQKSKFAPFPINGELHVDDSDQDPAHGSC